MSRQLPVPLRPGRSEPRAERPEVIVLESRSNAARGSSAFGKLLLSLTPDLIRVVEQSLAQRSEREKRSASQITPLVQQDMRTYRGGIQLSEVEYDTSLPFLRKVTVRKASAWTSDSPFVAPVAEPAPRGRGGSLRWAGLASVGGAVALAALGLLANRIPGLGSRRGY
jgi:hypothetical protein